MARILVLASHADSLVNFRGPLLEAFLAGGHTVHVAAPAAVARIDRSALAGRVTAHDVAMRRTATDPLADLRLMAAYAGLVRRVRPDMLLAYTIKPVIYGGLVARRLRVPAFFPLITGLGYVFENDGLRARIVRALVTPLYRRALRGAATVFFQNRDNLARFRTAGIVTPAAVTQVVAGSGVDLARFPPRDPPVAPAVLMIGRLLADKGVREYASAAKIVRAARPDVPFRLAGWFDAGNPAGIDAEELARWRADGTIDYLGSLDDVGGALAACTIYCLPSYHEGMPRTVLEAMATGRAIVTTDVAGCRDTVADGPQGPNGLLVPAGDAGALAAAILRLLDDPALVARMAAASLARARDTFDVARVNQAMMAAMGLARAGGNG